MAHPISVNTTRSIQGPFKYAFFLLFKVIFSDLTSARMVFSGLVKSQQSYPMLNCSLECVPHLSAPPLRISSWRTPCCLSHRALAWMPFSLHPACYSSFHQPLFLRVWVPGPRDLLKIWFPVSHPRLFVSESLGAGAGTGILTTPPNQSHWGSRTAALTKLLSSWINFNSPESPFENQFSRVSFSSRKRIEPSFFSSTFQWLVRTLRNDVRLHTVFLSHQATTLPGHHSCSGDHHTWPSKLLETLCLCL